MRFCFGFPPADRRRRDEDPGADSDEVDLQLVERGRDQEEIRGVHAEGEVELPAQEQVDLCGVVVVVQTWALEHAVAIHGHEVTRRRSPHHAAAKFDGELGVPTK